LAVGLDEIESGCRMLARRLRAGLGAIAGVTLRDLGRDPSAIVSFTLAGHAARDVVRAADRAGITIGASDPSSTLLDAEARALPPLIRASPHYYNTESEIDRLIELCTALSATPAARVAG